MPHTRRFEILPARLPRLPSRVNSHQYKALNRAAERFMISNARLLNGDYGASRYVP